LVEVQALLGPGSGGGAGPLRPQTLGIDAARANLLLAVLSCRTAVEIPASAQMFAAAVGGISVTEPAADLAVALAMASVITDIPLPPDVVVFGELGLAGEVRTVPGADRRLAEAQRAGFTRALVPASMASAPLAPPPGLTVHGVRTLGEALSLAQSEAEGRGAPGTMPGWPTVRAAASL
jgi:DNA repair protein RadA/Sms